MYKLNNDIRTAKILSVNKINEDNSGLSIPFDPANTDYIAFKQQVADGVELQDPDGNVMTQAEVDAFLKTIP